MACAHDGRLRFLGSLFWVPVVPLLTQGAPFELGGRLALGACLQLSSSGVYSHTGCSETAAWLIAYLIATFFSFSGFRGHVGGLSVSGGASCGLVMVDGQRSTVDGCCCGKLTVGGRFDGICLLYNFGRCG